MYLSKKSLRYETRDGQQGIKRGPFLILMRDKNGPIDETNCRAIVKLVAMKQCGHWMMGDAIIKGKRIGLSGTYGADGLMVDVDTDVFNEGAPVPVELYEKWKNGGGWNSSGSEALDFFEWAQKTFKVKDR